jgi:hypothetical protein
MSRRKATDFSRIHPTDEAVATPERSAPHDQEGRRALFSPGTALPAETTTSAFVTISCGHCGEETALSAAEALRLAVPSFHVPFLKRGHGSWMRCPACRRHTWVSVQIRLP